MINWFVNVSSNYRGTVYVLTIAVALLSGYGMSLMNNNALVVDDIPDDNPVMVDLKYYEKTFNGVIPFEILIDGKKKGKALKLSTLKKVDQLYDVLKHYKELSSPLSVLDVIKYSKQTYYNGDPDEFTIPIRNEIGFISKYAAGTKAESNQLLSSFLSHDKSELRISLQMKDIGTKRTAVLLEDLREDVDKIFNPSKYNVAFTGVGVIVTKGVDALVSNLIMSLLLTVLIIASLMGFMFRNIRMVFISLLPNILPLFIFSTSVSRS